jgi:hypothetical protein
MRRIMSWLAEILLASEVAAPGSQSVSQSVS